MRVLVALVLLTTMSIVVAQPPPEPEITNITLSASPTVIQKNGYSLLIAQIESNYSLNDWPITFEIISGANLADLCNRSPPFPPECRWDSVYNKTNESGIALAYLIAGSETGVVKVRAYWSSVYSNIVEIDIVESTYGVRLSTDEPIKNVNQSEVARFSVIIKNIGLYTDNFSISVDAPPEVSWDLNKNYFELPSGETDIIILNASSTQVGYYTITVTATSVSGATDSINLYLNVTKAPISPFPNCNNPPTDPDDDGLYEDTNGNGVMDLNDLFVLFTNMDWVEENGYTPYFDFNGNEEMDVNDIFTLYLEMPT